MVISSIPSPLRPWAPLSASAYTEEREHNATKALFLPTNLEFVRKTMGIEDEGFYNKKTTCTARASINRI